MKLQEMVAQKTFRVKVTVNEAVTVYSSEYKVNYYDKLQNGSFETPKVSDAGTLTYKNAHFYPGSKWNE